MKLIDNLLNSITIYKTVLFGLLSLVVISLIASIFNQLVYDPLMLLASLGTLVGTSFVCNHIFSKLFKAPTNIESYLITALILFFIISPPGGGINELLPLIIVSVVAMGSKYILNFKGKHIFNPAAIAVLLIGFTKLTGASWWVATPVLFIPTAIIGFLVVRKLRRFSMFFAFLSVSMIEMFLFESLQGNLNTQTVYLSLTAWPIIFFGTIMLTEPLTTPPTKRLQVIYGALVGFLFNARFSIGPIIASPELALIIGNIFSYIVSPKERVMLVLNKIDKISSSLYSFYFLPRKNFKFKPGQYLEWTLPHKKPDIRGNRRFFTIASSPTEPNIMLGARISKYSSSFKRALINLQKGDVLSAGTLSGDFTLPEDKSEKLVFIAGGIGITPFRSMIKYLIDKNERRDIVLFHACSSGDDFIYEDIFKQAEKEIGLKRVCVINEKVNAPKDFEGEIGQIDMKLLGENVENYKNRKYFLSGANAMVESIKKDLLKAGIKKSQVMTDYFPGY